MTSTVYFNGAFLPAAEARVSVFDGGWLHGAGLFETMRAENGRVFRLESHMQRLCRSAQTLLTPLDRGSLPTPAVFAELLARNRLDRARVRLTLSSGSMLPEMDTDVPRLTLCITASELGDYPQECYERGVRALICGYRVSPTDPVAGHKSVGYLPRLLGLRDAQRGHCAEALWFTTSNQLAEGCVSNVFLLTGGILKTPPLNTPVLPGIARGAVLTMAGESGIEAEEAPLDINDVLAADEIILTNTIMQVMPVIRVERHDVGSGRPGPVAVRLLAEYRRLVTEECGGE